jgi:hypothetical protein
VCIDWTACVVLCVSSRVSSPYPTTTHQIHAATLPIWPDIDYVSFVSNRPDQVKGGTIRFTGMFTVNNFGQNDITYCGVS